MIPFLQPLLRAHRADCELVDAHSGSLVAASVEGAFDSPSRRKGLLGRGSLPDGHALVLAPCNAVHTVGMRFPIDVLFVSRDGRVVKIVERLGAWRLAGAMRASVTVELAAGAVRRTRVSVGDRVAIQRRSPAVRGVGPDNRLDRAGQVAGLNVGANAHSVRVGSERALFESRGASGRAAVKLLLQSRVTDRRRQQRSLFMAPADAQVCITIDAVLDSWEDDRAVVISPHAAAVGTEFLMHIAAAPGAGEASWAAIVMKCEPIISDGSLRYRLRLFVTPTTDDSDDRGTVHDANDHL